MHIFNSVLVSSLISCALVQAIPSGERATHVDSPNLSKRTTVDYTDRNCDTTCSVVAGGGPNEWDCSHMIEKYWAKGAEKYTIGPHEWFQDKWNSCLITHYNTWDYPIQYQWNELGSVADWLRQTCNAAHGAQAGSCTFTGDNVPSSSEPFIILSHS